LYLSLNLLVITELVLAPSIVSSSASLSWPRGTEFVDSCLKLGNFDLPSFWLSHDDSRFCRFFDDILFNILQSLADLDYRKSLIADRTLWELSGSSNGIVFGISATSQTLSHTISERIHFNEFDVLVVVAFILVRFQLWSPAVDNFI